MRNQIKIKIKKYARIKIPTETYEEISPTSHNSQRQSINFIKFMSNTKLECLEVVGNL